MANRVKEDEKNERIIRSLLKVTENRRCINCNSLGPQYVCTNFWTFVCTTCSGIHREFTHRVKSISMAKFTSQEVTALQGGGNMRAKEIYFKEWDPQRNSAPDSSNIEKLRDFIKHVYVDRRYTGEKSIDKPPRAKTGEDSYENRRTDTFEGSRSPPYERGYSDRPSPGGRSDDSNSRYTYDERRSPGYDRENRQYGVRPEIVNDWNREDRFGNGRRSEERRVSDVDSRSEGRSPDRQKDLDMSSPPMVRPVRDILGDNVSPLRIIGPPKPNGGRVADGSTYAQRSASFNSLASNNGNPVELKSENPVISLIDFDADPEPPVPSTLPQTQQSATVQSIAQPISSSVDNNWASFDFVTEVKVSQPPSNVNTLESALSELLVPASVPTHLPGMHNLSGAMETAPVSNISVSPVNSAQSMSGQWASVHPPNSLFPPTAAQPTSQQFTPFGGDSTNQFTPFGGDSQPWNLSPTLNTQGQTSAHTTQAPPAVSKPAQASGIVSQPLPVAEKTTGRKALPEDFFAAMYPPMPSPQPGWQTGPPAGMGFNMQYNTAVPVPVYPPSLKSTNPFDLNSGPAPSVQAPTFPSMASLQGALPNMAPPTNLLRTSSLATPPSTWMPPQPGAYQSAMPPQPGAYQSAMPPQPGAYQSAMSPQPGSYQSTLPPQTPSYQSALPFQPPSYSSAMPPSTYMGQHMPSNMAIPRHPGGGGFGNEQAGFGSIYSNQQVAGRYSAPATPSTFSSGGNPFG